MNGERRAEHARALGWSLATVVALLTALSILGILPWATRGELREMKTDIGARLERIERRTDAIFDLVNK